MEIITAMIIMTMNTMVKLIMKTTIIIIMTTQSLSEIQKVIQKNRHQPLKSQIYLHEIKAYQVGEDIELYNY